MARTPDGIQRPQHFAALTGIREVGAIWVFFYHSLESLNVPVARSGYLGVDLFFLLSGFVMSHAYRSQAGWTRRAYFSFIQARLARILPLHLFTLGLVVLLVLFWPGFAASYPLSDQRFGLGALVASMFLVQNWAFWLPTCWNAPSWSLSAEWGGYLAMPAFFAMARSATGWKMAAAACYACLAALIAVLALRGQWSVGLTGTPGMVRMACEMVGGCCLYRAFTLDWRTGNAVDLAGLALLGLGITLPNADALAVAAMPLIILAAACKGSAVQRVLSSKTAVFLGEVSFSIYLTHWIVIQAANRVLPSSTGTYSMVALQTGLIGTVVIGVSFLTYRLVELPSRRWGRNLSLKLPVLSA